MSAYTERFVDVKLKFYLAAKNGNRYNHAEYRVPTYILMQINFLHIEHNIVSI